MRVELRDRQQWGDTPWSPRAARSPPSPPSTCCARAARRSTHGRRLEALRDPGFVELGDPLEPSLPDRLAAGVAPERRSASTCADHCTEGDTTHFAILDEHGNGISWVQSLGLAFGAGVGVPELGLLLGDRLGRSCTLNPAHPNCCAPGKRPVNTILPWSVSTSNGLRRLGGTQGGDGQTQWNAQTLLYLLHDGHTPLQALSAPQWTYCPGADKVEAEAGPHLRVDERMPEETVEQLRGFGHEVLRKAGLGGVKRLVERGDGFTYGLDDGRQEGVTVGW
jgi:gamma-glutamyltranspeptidase/glutathione hydrolase